MSNSAVLERGISLIKASSITRSSFLGPISPMRPRTYELDYYVMQSKSLHGGQKYSPATTEKKSTSLLCSMTPEHIFAREEACLTETLPRQEYVQIPTEVHVTVLRMR